MALPPTAEAGGLPRLKASIRVVRKCVVRTGKLLRTTFSVGESMFTAGARSVQARPRRRWPIQWLELAVA